MSCVEYHLLLILICFMKNGISLDLRKKNCVGFSIIHKECKQFAFQTILIVFKKYLY